MTASFTPAQIERFKREAKQLHRVSAISHSQALDQIASANGYGNWSLLIKRSNVGAHLAASGAHPPFRFSRTPEEMRLALHKVPDQRSWGSPTRTDCAKAQVEDISQAFASPQNAVEFAIDYITCLLTVPRFKVYSAARANWEMRSWLPYSCHAIGDGLHILVNRRHKPVGQVSDDWANYEEFAQLHVLLTEEQCKSFAARVTSPHYLFNDGSPPWHSRADAEAYLVRLHILRNVLRG